MNLKEIIEGYLEEIGFDGLFNSDGECACKRDDLFPCDGDNGGILDCEPGFLMACVCEEEHGFHIGRKKDPSCELKACKSGLPGIVSVNENIGDGSWRTLICVDCAQKLGLKDGDDLP